MLDFPGLDRGRVLHETVIKKGLRELCPDIHFDLAGATNQKTPYINQRQGVYYKGRHITGMERGEVPEFAILSVREDRSRCEWSEADKDDAVIRYEEIPPADEHYADLYRRATSGKELDLMVKSNGRLVRCIPERVRKLPGSPLWLGWRETFEMLLRAKIPGITRHSLAAKFGVDMNLYPAETIPREMTEATFSD